MSFMTFPDFSEEKMAAFIDGMLSPNEMISFQKEMDDNPIMKDILADVQTEIDQVGVTAMDDFPGFRPEDTIGQIIPLIENPSEYENLAISQIDEIVLPPPLFDDDCSIGGDDSLQQENSQTNIDLNENLGRGLLDSNDDLGL